MMNSPIIEFDVHGMRTEDAVAAIQKKVEATLAKLTLEEFSYGREPKVKRITMGANEGITELILREL